jgi:hypothetical protein
LVVISGTVSIFSAELERTSMDLPVPERLRRMPN